MILMNTSTPIVAFADHITTVLELTDLRAMSSALFSLGLPVAWPLSEQPGFATAGIRFGNLNLELCAVDRQVIGLDDWLTFEPTDLDTLSTDLKVRGLDHDPFDRMEAGGHPIYTRVGLPGLATQTTAVQVCRTFFPTRTTGPVAPANEAGIIQVQAVRVAVDKPHRDAFSLLLAPRVIETTVTFAEGPKLVIDNASALAVQGLVVQCQDVAQAHAALCHAGLDVVDASHLTVGSLTVELTAPAPT